MIKFNTHHAFVIFYAANMNGTLCKKPIRHEMMIKNQWGLSAGHGCTRRKYLSPISMKRKIEAQFHTLINKEIRHVVLDAFGCGVFGVPAKNVAKLYKEALDTYGGYFDDFVFAVYDTGYAPPNAPTFINILNDYKLPEKGVTIPVAVIGNNQPEAIISSNVTDYSFYFNYLACAAVIAGATLLVLAVIMSLQPVIAIVGCGLMAGGVIACAGLAIHGLFTSTKHTKDTEVSAPTTPLPNQGNMF